MKSKIILLVEDNPDDESLMLRALKKNNIANEIVVAHDGLEALDYLFATGKYAGQSSPVMPELVLLDLKLPKLDGFEVLRRMRMNERTRYIPVVVLTTSTEQRDIVDSYKFGANSFVQKPVDFNKFIDATRQLGTYWLLINKTMSDD